MLKTQERILLASISLFLPLFSIFFRQNGDQDYKSQARRPASFFHLKEKHTTYLHASKNQYTAYWNWSVTHPKATNNTKKFDQATNCSRWKTWTSINFQEYNNQQIETMPISQTMCSWWTFSNLTKTTPKSTKT